ncbi:hypothetical protein K469DRAFT_387705 [Zopfia rhizophila CBS 207.26]|uniref:Uncharacterized protein n=1 Tax=Zopfia rhizophila CBS 207.26 TaxID=1314779 RepID=A0A6A6EFP7_9PEZI|nr:hypothetical protein K469DRAFT_387705 [Zopfia rhizophila CBS 207.26]
MAQNDPCRPSETSAARIPNITILRQQLQYGEARLARCNAFYDDLRVFRKKYNTPTGLRGVDLHDWRSPVHQSALAEMTLAFLETEGNGEVYWPSDATSPNFNPLQYSKDHHMIKKIVKQLIFRLNQQQYRNTKYKRKGEPVDNEPGNLQPQPVYNSIEINSDESPAKTPSVSPPVNVDDIYVSSNAPPRDIAATNSFARRAQNVYIVDDDPFEVPDSPDIPPSDKMQYLKRKSRSEKSSRLPKRPKSSQSRKFANRINPQTDNNQSSGATKRTSPRGKKTIHRPERANTEEFNMAVGSPPLTTRSGAETHKGQNRDPKGVRQTPEEIINYIRRNRPSVTSETSTSAAHIRRNSRMDPPIDPGLDPIIPSPLPQLSRSTSVSSIAAETAILAQQRPLPSPASMAETLQQTRETSKQTPASPKRPQAQTPVQKQSPASTPALLAPLAPPVASLPAPQKRSVDFVYRAIISRSPLYQYKTWKPRGRFQDKSLAELIQELPFDKDIKGLILRLQGPGIAVQETVNCDEEEKFDTAKRRFNKLIGICNANQARAHPGKTLILEFEIEPLKSDDQVNDDEDEVVEVEW